jgi:hypothetical protein
VSAGNEIGKLPLAARPGSSDTEALPLTDSTPFGPWKEPVMLRCVPLALVVLLLAGVAHAQDAPEALLPATTQVYLHWDGVEAHRAAYEKTAVGKMMKGDLGAFLSGGIGDVQKTLSGLLTARPCCEARLPTNSKNFTPMSPRPPSSSTCSASAA